MNKQIKWRISRQYLITRYAGYTYKNAIAHFCNTYNCTRVTKCFMVSCTEEDSLMIKLICPDAIEKVYD